MGLFWGQGVPIPPYISFEAEKTDTVVVDGSGSPQTAESTDVNTSFRTDIREV